MLNINEVTVCGCLGRDPDLHYGSQNNTAFVSLSVATNRSIKKDDGQYENVTDWHTVVAYGKTAETIDQYLRKGSPIWVRGRLQTRKYQDKNGVDRWVTEIICERFQFVQGQKGGDPQPQQQQTQSRVERYRQDHPAQADEDVPF